MRGVPVRVTEQLAPSVDAGGLGASEYGMTVLIGPLASLSELTDAELMDLALAWYEPRHYGLKLHLNASIRPALPR